MRNISLITLICSLFFSTTARTQCMVRSEILGDSTYSIMYTNLEPLKVKVPEKEVANFYGLQTVMTYDNQTGGDRIYAIQVKYGDLPPGLDVPPREIVLKFTDGMIIRKKAANMYKAEEYWAKLYAFHLDASEVKSLKSKSLTSIIFVDYRQSLSVSCIPYPRLLIEGFECLEKRLKRDY